MKQIKNAIAAFKRSNHLCPPDDDLPTDFAERRDACYERLGLPRAADAFIAKLKAEMTDGLDALDRDLPRNPKVKLKPHRRPPSSSRRSRPSQSRPTSRR